MTSKFNPNNYKNLADDSEMIQAAVDAANETGEKVIIPRFNERTGKNIWIISRAIRLYSGSVICLDNCVLRQADGVFDNIFVNSNQGTPLGFTREGRQHDIKIYGRGNALLDGGNHNGITEHTYKLNGGGKWIIYNCMINFLNTERITVENIRITNQRYWSMVFHYCAHTRISNIDYYTPATSTEQDGIDLRTGCNHFTIENITGSIGDDVVALTCVRSNFDEDIAPAKLDDSIHHVTIRNVCATTPAGLVRVLNHNGKKIYNIIIENVSDSVERDSAQERGWDNPPLDTKILYHRPGAAVRIGENFYFGDGEKAKPEDTYNITVRNVSGRMRMGVKVNCALNNALFDNIQLYGEGGTGVYFGEGKFKNITVRNIGYSLVHNPAPGDDNRKEKYYNGTLCKLMPPLPDREICSVYFKECEAENIVFDNIYASDKLTAVFGGNGNVTMHATNIVRENSDTPVFAPELTVSKMCIDEF